MAIAVFIFAVLSLILATTAFGRAARKAALAKSRISR